MIRYFSCFSKHRTVHSLESISASNLLTQKLPQTRAGLHDYETLLHQKIQYMTLEAEKAKTDTEMYITAGQFPLVYLTIELRGEILKLLRFLEFQVILVEKILESFTEESH